MQTSVLKEAKRLYRLGFAIHWLHPRSKRPIGNEWAKGPRKSWDELKESFQPTLNVGVRLGAASRIDERGYLCVVDVDIKSSEKRHRVEAIQALKSLVGENAKCPEVRSGRGNGSRHLYCVTPKPFKTWNPFESKELIRVKMPSKSPSKREHEQLTADELSKGWRLSKAWEISLYSDGRQVVLPPSIHPDTGKNYFWKEHLLGPNDLPTLDFGGEPGAVDEREQSDYANVPRGTAQENVDDFTADESLDVRWLPGLDKHTRELIVRGIWKGKKIEDRSAYLLVAASGLVSAGLKKNEILTILTDKTTHMGECAYEHAGNTKSRARAAKWLWNYTVKKVMTERDPGQAFRGVAVVSDEASDAEDAARDETESWKDGLERDGNGRFKATLNNCKLILMGSAPQKNVVGRDEFAHNDFYLCDSPWRSMKGDAVVDVDIVRVKFFCAENFGIEFGDNIINQALVEIADVNRFHPVREYILSCDWDGVPRIETWLKEYAGAVAPDAYLRAVSRKVLVAMVKRVFEPGCKFDHVLILEGLQGVGKSTLLARLAGKWFTDQPLVIGDKDAVLTMQSKWLIELGELASLNRSEVEQMKAFVTQRTDRIRAPYGKRVEEFPRQSVFIGSTNQDEYLKDETGNRRFWPVHCAAKLLDFDGIEKVRDQLFGEAYAWYQLNEPLYLENAELNELARIEQAKRGEVDEWYGAVVDAVSCEVFPRKAFEMREVTKLMDANLGAARLDRGDQMRIAKILRSLGFEKFQESGRRRRKLWREPPGTTRTTLNGVGGSTKKVSFPPLIADFY